MKSLYLIPLLLLLVCNSHNKHDRLVELIKFHQQTKSNFAIQDAYKLLYQSVFGVAHMIDNPTKAKTYLQQEFDSIDASIKEPLIEPISPDSEIVRVNLRPFKARHNSIDTLFQVMVISAQEIQGTLEDFLKIWHKFKQAVQKKQLDFNESELLEFDKKIKLENYPPIHHSKGYLATNKPAYRVVKRRIFNELILLIGT